MFLGIHPIAIILNHRRIRSFKPKEIQPVIRKINVTDVFCVNSLFKEGCHLLMLPGRFSAASDTYNQGRLLRNHKYLGIPWNNGGLASRVFLLLGDDQA